MIVNARLGRKDGPPRSVVQFFLFFCAILCHAPHKSPPLLVRGVRATELGEATTTAGELNVQFVSRNCSVGFLCGLLVATRVPQVLQNVEWG
jgi:hypothetical protein